jgi:hypothetical protein
MTLLLLSTESALADLRIKLQEIIDLVSYGLGVEPPSPRSARNVIPGTPFQINPHPTWALEPENAELRFRTWTIGNGFRELLDTAVTNFLEAVFLDCRALTFLTEQSSKSFADIELEVEDFNSRIASELSKFRKIPLIQKLGTLKKHYGLRFETTLEECILSIQRARNCLTHNQGMVTSNDFDEDGGEDGLPIMWVHIEITKQTGGQPFVIKSKEDVGSGGLYEFGSRLLKKIFKAGAQLVISPRDFTEIAFTLFIFSQTVAEAVSDHASGLGYDIQTEVTDEERRQIYLYFNEGKIANQAIPVEWRDGRLRFPRKLFKEPADFGGLF